METYTVITQPASKKIEHIHDRMPAILLPEQEKLWIDNTISPDQALQLIIPYPDDLIDAYTVGERVGKVTENDKGLIDEVKDEAPAPDLFS